jgi:hypothetical protein
LLLFCCRCCLRCCRGRPIGVAMTTMSSRSATPVRTGTVR